MFWVLPAALAGLIIVTTLAVVWWRFATRRSRTYIIIGVVKAGYGLGDQVGLHTANFDTALAGDLPKGLYASAIYFENKQYDGLLYYGYNSLTTKNCLEVHLFDFNTDLYGKAITVKTTGFIRPEKKFNSPEALRAQVQADVAAAKK